jgi:hypothetical protein
MNAVEVAEAPSNSAPAAPLHCVNAVEVAEAFVVLRLTLPLLLPPCCPHSMTVDF